MSFKFGFNAFIMTYTYKLALSLSYFTLLLFTSCYFVIWHPFVADGRSSSILHRAHG